MKVSVIIPVYNTEKYLRQCLDDILEQTLEDIEVICVDDGSTDESGKILDEYAAKDARLKVMHCANSGAGAARNAGIDAATGEYLYFMDADDRGERTLLEETSLFADETGADIVVFNYANFNDGETLGDDVHMNQKRFAFLSGEEKFCIAQHPKTAFSFGATVWDKLFRRELIEKNHIRYDNGRCCNDVFFSYYSQVQAEKVACFNKVFYYHRSNAKGNISSTRSRYITAIVDTMEHLRQKLIEDGKFEKYEPYFTVIYRQCLGYEQNNSSWRQNIGLMRYALQRMSGRRFIGLFGSRMVRRGLRQLFSVANSCDRKHKVCTLLGVKIKFRRRKKH